MKFSNPMVVRVLNRMSLICAVFLLVVSLILTLNFVQYRSSNPLDSTAIESLLKYLQNNPDDPAIRDHIRAMDLLQRKAFFTSVWQVKTGLFLLLFFTVIMITSVKLRLYLTEKDQPAPLPKRSSRSSRIPLILFMITVFFTGGLFSILTIRDFGTEGFLPSMTRIPLDDFPEESSMKENWPVFRGYRSQGIAYDQNPPVDWDIQSGKNILWKTPLENDGFSSPVVWEDRIFITGSDSESRDIYCYDFKSGALMWTYSVKDMQQGTRGFPSVSEDTGYSAPTPAVDGKRVYALFATGYLAAVDFDGRLVWSETLGVPDNLYGHSSSLQIHGDNLFVQYDHSLLSHLICYKTDNGRKKWSRARSTETAWTSPILAGEDDPPQLILTAEPGITSYDAENGRLLWEIKLLRGELGSSPAYHQGVLFAGNRFSTFAAVDMTSGEILWEYDEDLPDASSPVAVNSIVFMTSGTRVISALNAKDGSVLWTEETSAGFYSSPIYAGGRIYTADTRGEVRIFEASERFSLIAQISMEERIDATPAFVRNRIIFRTAGHLYCIGESDE